MKVLFTGVINETNDVQLVLGGFYEMLRLGDYRLRYPGSLRRVEIIALIGLIVELLNRCPGLSIIAWSHWRTLLSAAEHLLPGKHSADKIFCIFKTHHFKKHRSLTAAIAATAIEYHFFILQIVNVICLHRLDLT